MKVQWQVTRWKVGRWIGHGRLCRTFCRNFSNALRPTCRTGAVSATFSLGYNGVNISGLAIASYWKYRKHFGTAQWNYTMPSFIGGLGSGGEAFATLGIACSGGSVGTIPALGSGLSGLTFSLQFSVPIEGWNKMKSIISAVMAFFFATASSALAYDGVMVDLTTPVSPVSVPNSYYAATYVKVPFNRVVYDLGGFWDASSKQIVIPATIPAGTYGIIRCNLRWQPTNGYRIQVLISKYDASSGQQMQSGYPEAMPDNRLFTGGTTADHFTVTHPVLLEPGDAYACQVWQQGTTGSAGAITVMSAGMSLQVL